MSALATNTFATVSFDEKAQFDFESLVTEFQQALDDGLSGPTRMRRVGEEFVSSDMGRAQFGLAYSGIDRDSGRTQQAGLAVKVGAAEAAGKSMSFEERVRFCNGVLDRIEAAYAVDQRVWGEPGRGLAATCAAEPQAAAASPATSAGPKRVRKQAAAGRRSRPNGPQAGVADHGGRCATTKGPAEPIRLTHPALYADMVRQTRVTALTPPRVQPPRVAFGLPQTEARDLGILRSVFLPDDAETEMRATDRPVAHRLAIYTLNTSLVVICLPVGAAMFSYCALGRENLNAVGRAMALTGIGIALTQNSFLGAIMPLIG